MPPYIRAEHAQFNFAKEAVKKYLPGLTAFPKNAIEKRESQLQNKRERPAALSFISAAKKEKYLEVH